MACKKHFYQIYKTRMGRAVAVSLIAIASAGCSTDVTRFAGLGESFMPGKSAATASIPEVSRTKSAPLERVRTEPLAPPPAKPYGMARHITVEEGDTLYGISRRHNVSIDEIAATNRLQKPYSVKVGQYLMIPAPGVPRTVWNKPAARPAAAARKVTSIAKNGRSYTPRNPAFANKRSKTAKTAYHTVQGGETLYGISRQYGVKPADLARQNNLGPDLTIRTGQRLRLPGQGTKLAMASGAAMRTVPLPRPAPSAVRGKTVKSKDTAATRPVKTAKAAPALERGVKKPVKIVKQQAPPQRSYGKFRWPVKGRIISEFGRKSDGSRNDGINFSVPMGASVKAAENGVVAYAGNELKGFGNLVLIRHSGDWVTAYAHNSKLLVRHGQKVRRGDIIAKAGQTGSVSRPQLHFEIRKGAQAVNPRKYLAGSA